MLQHALDDIVGAPSVLGDFFEIACQHFDRFVDLSRVWPDRVIEEGNLRAQIRALHVALADPDLIRTVAGRGYQFTGEVHRHGGRGQGPIEREVAAAVPAVATRLSIAVLPFLNLSDDREQQYFADGITEDLTTDLSRLAGYSIISRNTALPIGTDLPTQSTSVASWVCAVCWKEASRGRATASVSAPS
jgi:hypothetical protein